MARTPVKSRVFPGSEFPKIKRFWENKAVFGKNPSFLGTFLEKFRRAYTDGKQKGKVLQVRKKGYKGRCEKRMLSKSKDVCRLYDKIQSVYADVLQESQDVKEIRCNVPLDGVQEGEYTSDFVCIRSNNDWMVRECVFRKQLTKPMTVKLLDVSREYWLRRGVTDWGLVIDGEK